MWPRFHHLLLFLLLILPCEGWQQSRVVLPGASRRRLPLTSKRLPLRALSSTAEKEGEEEKEEEEAAAAPITTSLSAPAATATTTTTPLTESSDGTKQLSTVGEALELFWDMSVPYFREETAARWLLAGVVALTLMNSGVSVAFSYLSRDFYTALNAKDSEQFQQVLIKFTGALAAGVPVVVLNSFQRERLALRWREWMTERILTLYMGAASLSPLSEATAAGANEETAKDGSGEVGAAASAAANAEEEELSIRVGAYYAIEGGSAVEASYGGSLDNPDQRIAEDVRSFTRSSLSFAVTILRAVIDLCSFSAILYSIYPVLFAVIVVYAGVGTAVTVWLGQRLVELNYEVLQREADFRFR